jgi:hypothetical protein
MGWRMLLIKTTLYLHSSTTFDHTYETTVYDMDSSSGIATTITESKTLTEFTYYDVELNTVGIASSSFTAFDDLEEDQVLQWCFDAHEDTLQIRQAQEAKVLEAKDKVLNPLKYYRDSPVTPWRRRADEASSRNI